MAIDEGGFKAAMSQFVSGLTVVKPSHAGEDFGMTVASFASLSLRPPLVLVCIESAAKSHAAIASAGAFGVSILGSEQADISGRFASRAGDKFAETPIRRGELGVPLIEGAICTLECRVTGQLPGGDHSIFVGAALEGPHARCSDRPHLATGSATFVDRLCSLARHGEPLFVHHVLRWIVDFNRFERPSSDVQQHFCARDPARREPVQELRREMQSGRRCGD